MARIAILGCGRFGSVVGGLLKDAGNDVTYWGKRPEAVKAIEGASCDIGKVLDNADCVFVAIAAQHAREVLEKYKSELLERPRRYVSLMKGIEVSTGMLMSEMILDVLGVSDKDIFALAGPNIARDIKMGDVIGMTIAGSADTEKESLDKLVNLFVRNSQVRTEKSFDIVGIQLMSCLKNVYAIMTG
ncbi:MAG: NAD(P)-binding domain-containing protein, partial [Candidatus Ancillula sp.]|nr:NAD(P)-binding domain-containing protein [Candidatus Ancillula sp.]